MKGSKLKWILLSLTTVFVLGVGGVFIYVSKEVTPEKVRARALQELQQAFPKAKVEIGQLDLGFGLSIKVEVAKFKMALAEGPGDQLFSVDDVTIKIPLWSIITKGGTVTITVQKPDFTYKEYEKGNNWTTAMGGDAANTESSSPSEESTSNEGASNKVRVPAFLVRTKLNLNLHEMKVHYGLKDGSKGEVALNRFVVKELGLGSPTAFELDSKLDLKLAPPNKVAFSTLVIGQFNLAEYISNGSLSSVLVIKLADIKMSPGNKSIPEAKIDLNVKMEKGGAISGNSTTTLGSSKLVAKFELKEKKTTISGIDADFLLEDLIAMAGADVPVKAGQAHLKAQGEFSMDEDGKMKPNVKFSLSPEVTVEASGVKVGTTMEGSMKGTNLQVDILSKMLEGRVETNVKGDIDINKKPFDPSQVRPLDVDVRLVDLKIAKSFIQEMMYGKKDATGAATASAGAPVGAKPAEGPNAEQSAAQSGGGMLPARVNLTLSRVKLDAEDLSGKGVISIGPKKIAVEKMDLGFSGGTVAMNAVTTLRSNGKDAVFNLNMTRINMKGFNAFLPPMLKGVEGIFTGQVNGSAKMDPKTMNYDVTVNVNATKGEIKGLDLTEKVNALLGSLPILKDKVDGSKKYDVNSNFETFALKGKFTDVLYQIEKFEFNGVNKSVEIKGNGKVFPPPQKESADLFMDLQDNTGKLSGILEKNVGTKILPMKLIGPGFELKPDYQYTIGKLAKSGFDNKLKAKVQEKAQDKLKDVLNEKLKGEGVNKLLKGIFK